MFKRFLLILMLALYSSLSWGHQTCENIQIGSNPIYNQNSQIIGYQPIFQQECTWYYAAIAVDPNTRVTAYAYNYKNIHEAEKYVIDSCGPQCVWMSTSNVGYIALSEDGTSYGTSDRSAQDAIQLCGMVSCDWVIMTGTAAAASSHSYGALAFSPLQATGGQAWQYFWHDKAELAAKKSCGAPDCWAYVYDSLYAAMAQNDNGRLFAKSSNSSEATVIRDTLKYCKEEGKSDTCHIVMLGNKFNEITDNQRKEIVEKAIKANMLQRIFD